MLYHIKKYPFSLAIILLVVYLSLFRPPAVGLTLFPGWDKIVHFCMYMGISGVLWLEFLLNHRKEQENLNVLRGVTGAVLLPILLGGMIELGQTFLTSYRSGDWLDMLANTGGVAAASLVAWFKLRPIILKKR